MALHGFNQIGYDRSAEGSDSYQAVNPSTGELLPGTFREATLGEVEKACIKAAAAFGQFSGYSGMRRAEFLDSIAVAILEREETLKQRLADETAYPEARILSERNRTVDQLRMFASMLREGSWVRACIDTGQPDRKPLPKADIRQYQIGAGPIVVFGASNFPQAFSTAGGDTASAFAAGCPVIVKAHRAHPGTAEIYADAIVEAARKTGMPDGIFSLIHSSSHSIGEALVKDPRICAVGFTGSYRGGRMLFDLAAARLHPIPVYAEMSSTNPVFLLPEALKTRTESVADGYTQSLTLGVGQFCTSPGMVIALRGPDADAFMRRVAENLEKLPVGTLVHPSIKKGYDTALRERCLHASVKTVFQSSSKGVFPGTEAPPALLQSTAAEFLAHPEIGDEIFGPAGILILCENRDEMLKVASSLAGQLTGTLQATAADLEGHRDLIAVLSQKVGRLLVNGFPTGVEVCPSMHHGGPFPSTTFPHFTSVGTAAVYRFTRPVCFQGFPDAHLPPELQQANPLNLMRLVNGEYVR